MAEEISLSIRKLLENTSFYLIVGQTKTKKLLLTGLKTKHNVIVLTPRHTILHPTVVTVQHPFQHYKKKSSLCTCDPLARIVGGNKNDTLPPFVNVKALLFSI
jgi:hypothetical protein